MYCDIILILLSTVEGSSAVIEPSECSHIPQVMKDVTDV